MKAILLAVLFLSPIVSVAQARLDAKISIAVRQKPLAQVLTEIGKRGGFSFSYNTSIIRGDSLVTIAMEDTPVRMILDKLLGENYDYIESGHYVILLLKATPLPVKSYTVSGYVKDQDTREKISNVSVYENEQLVATLTDTNGFFRIRLHDRAFHSSLVFSKQLYRDTLVMVRSGVDQELEVPISHATVTELPTFVKSARVEKTWLGRFMLSSRQVVHSMNLLGYLASKPVQLSLIPVLGTHGLMGGQIVNKLSLNIVGGYTAGVNGLELGGAFNIDRNDANGVQGAGVVNMVGGTVRGVQLAGVCNDDLGPVYGVQLAGVVNYAQGDVNGVQGAGVVNISRGEVKGVQIGLVNFADTSSGYMIGILNFVKRGMHELTVSADETFPVNLAYKVGNNKAYSILQLSYDPVVNQRAYGLGFGIGHRSTINQRLAIATEISIRQLYLGQWNNPPSIDRLQSSLQWSPGKKISLFAGPSISYYQPGKQKPASGYKSDFPGSTWWLGWSAGINFF